MNVLKSQCVHCAMMLHIPQVKLLSCRLCVLLLLQVVVWSPAVGNLHPRRVSVPRGACGGALQAAKGGTSHGETLRMHSGAVSSYTERQM